MDGKLPLGVILNLEKKPLGDKKPIIFFLLGLVIGFIIGMAIFKTPIPPSIVPYNFPSELVSSIP